FIGYVVEIDAIARSQDNAILMGVFEDLEQIRVEKDFSPIRELYFFYEWIGLKESFESTGVEKAGADLLSDSAVSCRAARATQLTDRGHIESDRGRSQISRRHYQRPCYLLSHEEVSECGAHFEEIRECLPDDREFSARRSLR